MLFLKHLWSDVPQLHFLDFHYAAQGLDVGFDPEFPTTGWQASARVTAKTGPSLINIENMDAGLSPTKFQTSTYPEWVQNRIRVIHDGINTQHIAPDPNARLKIKAGGKVLKYGGEMITFVNRNLEPYRGYHRFIRALPAIQKAYPNAITIIVDGNGVSYGEAAPNGMSWKNIFLEEVSRDLDLSRIIFAGTVAYETYLAILRVSSCHVYFSYPFVLGWSCLEAMACGALVVGSATAPVEEVITKDINGCIVDFFDQDALVATVIQALKKPERFSHIRKNARKTIVDNYDLNTKCLPEQIDLIQGLVGPLTR